MHYPERLEITPLARPPHATVRVPGSKSITNRALVLAALFGRGQCRVAGALHSEDTEVMVDSLRKLGFRVTADWTAGVVEVARERGAARIPVKEADLFVANSGTSMRFLTALVAAGQGRYRLDGIARMRERPIDDLLTGLQQLGVHTRSELGNGCPPVIVEANGLRGGSVVVKGDVSSQFLSALLLAAPAAEGDLEITVEGDLVSKPYIDMTVGMLHAWGLKCVAHAHDLYLIPGGQQGDLDYFAVEPDASAASYFLAAAAICQGRVVVPGLDVYRSWQGDVKFASLLAEMGCEVPKDKDHLLVRGQPLHGIDVDMNAISDTVMTLAAVACFAEGPTTIRNVAHIRHKETDRLTALANELRKVGADVVEFRDGLTITPQPLHGAELDTYNDHRMAMSLALIGLKVPGIVIKNPGCVAKTYPNFWQDLERLRS
ncbi:MAG: 3-phosphoshikimate 1-carboxyvinyltransferase [Planctomycetia bacterium]|nr:3-phosphoshikimate 1-carboxyvinyltransferase [Planctomycetia bacterium]